jgi:hypothetical protein
MSFTVGTRAEVSHFTIARATPGVTTLGGYTGQSQGRVIPALALTPKLRIVMGGLVLWGTPFRYDGHNRLYL